MAYEPAANNTVRYGCDNGITVTVAYFDSHAMLFEDEREDRLEQTRSGSGFLYKSDMVKLRGKGKQIVILRSGSEPANCFSSS